MYLSKWALQWNTKLKISRVRLQTDFPWYRILRCADVIIETKYLPYFTTIWEDSYYLDCNVLLIFLHMYAHTWHLMWCQEGSSNKCHHFVCPNLYIHTYFVLFLCPPIQCSMHWCLKQNTWLSHSTTKTHVDVLELSNCSSSFTRNIIIIIILLTYNTTRNARAHHQE